MGMRRALVGIAALIMASATVSVALAAPAVAKTKQERGVTYVGTVDGTDAYIGIVVGKQGAFGYVCDGDQITHWVTGTLKKGTVTLAGVTGASVVAKLSGTTLKGSVLFPDLSEHTFVATRARGKAGLQRQEKTAGGTRYAAGWVVFADRSFRGQVTVAAPIAAAVPTTAPPVTAPPTTKPPTTAAPAATAPPTAPPTTAPVGNPGGVTTTVTNVGAIAPPDVQSLFPVNPLSTQDKYITKAPVPSHGCIVATGQYNLAYQNWLNAGHPGSGGTYDTLLAARDNFVAKCGGVQPGSAEH